MDDTRTLERTEKRLSEAIAAARARRLRTRRARRHTLLARSRHHELELQEAR